MTVQIGFIGTAKEVTDYTHSFVQCVMDSKLYNDNPSISLHEYWVNTMKEDMEIVRKSLEIGFEDYKSFETHNGDMNVSKEELLNIWSDHVKA